MTIDFRFTTQLPSKMEGNPGIIGDQFQTTIETTKFCASATYRRKIRRRRWRREFGDFWRRDLSSRRRRRRSCRPWNWSWRSRSDYDLAGAAKPPEYSSLRSEIPSHSDDSSSLQERARENFEMNNQTKGERNEKVI